MPQFLRQFFPSQKDTAPVNHFDGFTSDGRVVVEDRRGTRKAGLVQQNPSRKTGSNKDNYPNYAIPPCRFSGRL
jgi:hypothetical protein